MPARHRHRHSSEHRKLITITLESCSRCAGNREHHAPEYALTVTSPLGQALTKTRINPKITRF
jgi:hypothetical protein